MSRADFLKQAGFEISDSSAEALAARMHPKTLVKGEYLFYKGDPSDALHTVESGSLESVATSYEGRDLVFKSIGPGETIGEHAPSRPCPDDNVVKMFAGTRHNRSIHTPPEKPGSETYFQRPRVMAS